MGKQRLSKNIPWIFHIPMDTFVRFDQPPLCIGDCLAQSTALNPAFLPFSDAPFAMSGTHRNPISFLLNVYILVIAIFSRSTPQKTGLVVPPPSRNIYLWKTTRMLPPALAAGM